jgi:hypothetical protein
MSPEQQTIRISVRQRHVVTEALKHRLTQLSKALGKLGASYIHGGAGKHDERRILKHVLYTIEHAGLPPRLSLYEHEWPAFSRALRSTREGQAFYLRLTRSSIEQETFTFTADRAARAADRRARSRARPLGRPRKSWSTGETI